MSPEEIRFACITLAHDSNASTSDVVKRAELYADFILGTEHAKGRERLEGIEKAMFHHILQKLESIERFSRH